MKNSPIGCRFTRKIPSLGDEKFLLGRNPVTENSSAPPPPGKGYIDDLLNRGFITKSKSSYSSPAICVCKRDNTLRLCVDFRVHNKTVPDKLFPLPRIQQTLENLGGNEWFSILDMNKAYHQGCIDPLSRRKTAFVGTLRMG